MKITSTFATSLVFFLVLGKSPAVPLKDDLIPKDQDLKKLAGTYFGRSGAVRDVALRDGGGTPQSEAAIVQGLQWLARHQGNDGNWKIDDPRFPDKGMSNDVAATAMGLLPFLGAGKTQRAVRDNPYEKVVEKGLLYLIRKQDVRTGNLGGGMYAHGLAAIALCEAYGLTKDPNLRGPAQAAINFIFQAQHRRRRLRDAPGQVGDTSVTGWQIMALKSAQWAELNVPNFTLAKVPKYLDTCVGTDEGYGYTGPGSTPSMTAIGLLSRQYLQGWNSKDKRLLKGVANILKPNPPSAKNMYYTFYATQVMHHIGGDEWKAWNGKIREGLITAQDKEGAMAGSWSSKGDNATGPGGRLFQTSLSLMTLEVYYRHLPLHYAE